MEEGKYSVDTDPWTPRLSSGDIPFLLDRADSKRALKCFPTNSISSFLQSQCSEGMVALWLVEGVRTKSYLPSLNALCLKINGNQSADLDHESETHHSRVAAAYCAWWRNGQADPHAAFKINPLKGTGLYWH